jgi:hypothetical protein
MELARKRKFRMVKTAIVARSLFGTGVSCFVGRLLLSAYFMGHRPTTPQIELGRHYAFNQHGGVVYLTQGESLFLTGLFWAAAIAMAVGASMFLGSRPPAIGSQKRN